MNKYEKAAVFNWNVNGWNVNGGYGFVRLSGYGRPVFVHRTALDPAPSRGVSLEGAEVYVNLASVVETNKGYRAQTVYLANSLKTERRATGSFVKDADSKITDISYSLALVCGKPNPYRDWEMYELWSEELAPVQFPIDSVSARALDDGTFTAAVYPSSTDWESLEVLRAGAGGVNLLYAPRDEPFAEERFNKILSAACEKRATEDRRNKEGWDSTPETVRRFLAGYYSIKGAWFVNEYGYHSADVRVYGAVNRNVKIDPSVASRLDWSAGDALSQVAEALFGKEDPGVCEIYTVDYAIRFGDLLVRLTVRIDTDGTATDGVDIELLPFEGQEAETFEALAERLSLSKRPCERCGGKFLVLYELPCYWSRVCADCKTVIEGTGARIASWAEYPIGLPPGTIVFIQDGDGKGNPTYDVTS